MKLTFFTRSTFAILSVAALGGGAFALWAADNHGVHAPLKFQIDTKAIDRDAGARVSYASIVKKAAPSVVYISSSKTLRAPRMSIDLNDPAIRRFFGGQIPGSLQPRNLTQESLGSGVIVSNDGYILTNNHVIDGADEVTVSIGEPRKDYPATVVGRDAKVDVAVLKIDASGLPAVTLGDSDQLQVGDTVFAIGNPFGIGMTVTHGIVSALGRGGLGIEAYEDFIQTDAAINPGNSGGALIDTQGRVVGLNTAILSESGASNGVSFAIPVNLARSIADQLVSKGKVDRAFLGVGPQDLTSDFAAEFGTAQGALLAEVLPGSPADNAGLKHGDVITKINGEEIADARHLTLAVGNLSPGTAVSVEYVRDGKTHTAKIELAPQPGQTSPVRNRPGGGATRSNPAPAPKEDGVLNGVTVADLTPQYRAQLQLPRTATGAVVTQVDPASASARAGLAPGDVITELDRHVVDNADQAVKLSSENKGPKAVVLVTRNGSSHYLAIDESK